MWILPFVILLTSPASFAANKVNANSCPDGTSKPTSEIDMRASFPPIADQDGIGWCYAYGSAAQMSYWAIQNHTPGVSLQDKHYVSSAAGALMYDREERNAEYGKTAARLLLKKLTQPRIAELTQQKQDLYSKIDARREFFQNSDPELVQLNAQMSKLSKGKAIPVGDPADYPTSVPSPGSSTVDPADRQAIKDIKKKIRDKMELVLGADSEYKSLQTKLDRAEAEVEILDKSNENSLFKEPEGGTPKKILEQLSSNGLCLESQVSSTDNAPSSKLYSNWLSAALGDSYQKYLENRSSENICAASTALHQLFPTIGIPEIQKILANSLTTDQEDPIETLWQKSCSGHLVNLPKEPSINEISKAENSNEALANAALSNQFKSLLDQGIPVGISYHSAVFDAGPSSLKEIVSADTSSHYSILVGKKFDCETKKTIYILRNSWGKDSCESKRSEFKIYGWGDAPKEYTDQQKKIWSDYGVCTKSCPPFNMTAPSDAETAKTLECLEPCEKLKNEAQINLNHPPYTCDKGDFLITEDQLMSGVKNATYLK